MKKHLYDVLLEPLITEKGTIQSSLGKYFFKVHLNANKHEIREAVEKIFNVKVTSVHTARVKGKPKRVRYQPGLTSTWKKAIVTLKQGQRIDFV